MSNKEPSNKEHSYDYHSLHHGEGTKSSLTYRPRSPWLSVALLAISAVFGALLGVIVVIHYHGVLEKPTSFLPEIPYDTITFVQDQRYVSSNPADPKGTIWDSLDPAGEGWIEIPEWKKWGLPSSPGRAYQIAMYHQLHCIASLKADTLFLYTLLDQTSSVEAIEGVKKKIHKESHTAHCLEYLRQSIMCLGDTTLEPFVGELGLDHIEHKCRNWDTLFEFATKHRKTNITGILN
ncbi:Hydroxylase cctR-like protein [Cladobotryum mycophilum]|uniref:Hydroxylase cctR-like protein n=1 Tax=Cladobotryum mycophilum TaxID=491253 RepID=A0ABR0SPW4_9HYPO